MTKPSWYVDMSTDDAMLGAAYAEAKRFPHECAPPTASFDAAQLVHSPETIARGLRTRAVLDAMFSEHAPKECDFGYRGPKEQ